MTQSGFFQWATRLQMLVFLTSVIMIGHSLFSLIRITILFVELTSPDETSEPDVFNLLLKNGDLLGNTMAVLIVSILLLHGNLRSPPRFYLLFVVVNSFVVFHWIFKLIYAQFIGKVEVNTRFFCLTTFAVQLGFVLIVWLARTQALAMRKTTADSSNSKAQLCLTSDDVFEKTKP